MQPSALSSAVPPIPSALQIFYLLYFKVFRKFCAVTARTRLACILGDTSDGIRTLLCGAAAANCPALRSGSRRA